MRRNWQYVLYGTWLAAFPGLALADVGSALNNLLAYLTGDIGKALAALAIVGAGFGCFALHKVSKAQLIAIVLGIGFVFGAKPLLAIIMGA